MNEQSAQWRSFKCILVDESCLPYRPALVSPRKLDKSVYGGILEVAIKKLVSKDVGADKEAVPCPEQILYLIRSRRIALDCLDNVVTGEGGWKWLQIDAMAINPIHVQAKCVRHVFFQGHQSGSCFRPVASHDSLEKWKLRSYQFFVDCELLDAAVVSMLANADCDCFAVTVSN